MLVTTIPYLLGYAAQGESYRFSGFVFGVEDGHSYIAKMVSGWAGDWLFRSPYSAYPQSGLAFYLPYLLLGKLADPPALHEQLVALFHIFRIGAGMLAIFATYDFLAYFVRQVHLRRFGLILVSLGGGMGWLFILIQNSGWLPAPAWMTDQWVNRMPLDFISPEAFGFLGLFGLPHLAAARALLLWALLAYLKLIESVLGEGGAKTEKRARRFDAGWRHALRLALLWLCAGLFQPLTLLIVGVVISVHQAGIILWAFITRKRDSSRISAHQISRMPWDSLKMRRLLLHLAAAALLPGAFLIYNFLVSQFDPYAKAWSTQNWIPSPHPLHYLLAYGLLLPYAWIGGQRLLKANLRDGWFLVGWILVFPALAYIPLGLQRRLTEGIWVAWCTLALAGVDLAPVGSKRRSWTLAPLALVFPSSLALLIGGAMTALKPAPPLFLPAGQVRAYEHLQAEVEPGAVVLSAYQSANSLPAWAPVRVLVGHGPESIHSSDLRPQVERFFQSETLDRERLDLIARFNIRYLFWGPEERALGGWSPANANYLELFYPLEQVQVYADYQIYLVKEADQGGTTAP